VAYVRTVKTSSGATAVQIVWSTRRGSRSIEHLGSAHDETEVEALNAAARQRLVEGQGAWDLGLEATGTAGAPLKIVSSRAGHLWDGLCRACRVLGSDRATGGDEVFRDLVLARIIEPTSKIDSMRVLAETGVGAVCYRTVERHLPGYATPSWRHALSAACAAHARLGAGHRWCSTTLRSRCWSNRPHLRPVVVSQHGDAVGLSDERARRFP